MKEIWKDIKDYEGYYQISNLGRIKSLPRNGTIKSERIIKGAISKNGYLRVCLQKNGIKTNFLVHRLVAEAFIPNPDNLPQVNHKDEDKTNNIYTNLEWCTASYNTNFGTCIERRIKKQSKKILQYTLDGEFVREWESIQECGRNGFNVGNICYCCQGKYKSSQGYIWKYKNPSDLIV